MNGSRRNGLKNKMATGNPQKKKEIKSQTYVIDYKGKKRADEILVTEKIKTQSVHDKNAEGELYFGDNKVILKHLLSEPKIRGKVDLVYIDPPFATGSEFISRKLESAYQDNLQGAQYIEFLRERIILIREMLSEEGSFYLHLDNRMICAAKIICDEVFGLKNFRNIITRKKSNPKNYTRNVFGNVTDFILFYTKTKKYIWNQLSEKIQGNQLKEYRYLDQASRRHMLVPLHAPGTRYGASGGQWRGMSPPPGKHWQYTPETLEDLDKKGHIHWSSNGNPRKKVYLDENQGVPVQDLWLDFKDAHNQNISITGYPTEKNYDLLQRIISASSNVGSLVMDCFAGSGTALDAAGQLNRKWIGIDESPTAITSLIKRIELGMEKMGDYVAKNGKAKKYISCELFPKKARRITFIWPTQETNKVLDIFKNIPDTQVGKKVMALKRKKNTAKR